MNKENIMKKTKEKTNTINIRTTEKISEWLKENKYSPTGIFNEAIKELGYKE